MLDVNVVVSGLMFPSSPPGQVLERWLEGEFDVLTCFEHIEELKRVTRYPKIRERISAHIAGRTINRLKAVAIYLDHIAEVEVCRDPFDNYLLGLAQTGRAGFLVTGDKADLLSLRSFGATRIITARQLIERFT